MTRRQRRERRELRQRLVLSLAQTGILSGLLLIIPIAADLREAWII